LKIIKPLVGKPIRKWSKGAIKKVVSGLKGYGAYNMRNASKEALDAYEDWYPKWETYLDKNPSVLCSSSRLYT
jgi:hypothetical protein